MLVNTWAFTGDVTRAFMLYHSLRAEAALDTDIKTGTRWLVPVPTRDDTCTATGLEDLAIGTHRGRSGSRWRNSSWRDGSGVVYS